MNASRGGLIAIALVACTLLGAAPAATAAGTYRYDREWAFGGSTDDIAGVAVSPTGRVYVVGEEQRMRRYSARGRLQRTWQLDYRPQDVAVAPDGRVHVLQSWHWQDETTWVKVYGPDGRFERQYTLAEGADWFPTQIAFDRRGNAFVVDTNDDLQAVHWFDPQGRHVVSAGAATGLGLDDPSGVTVGRNGDVFVADTGNHRIVQLAPDRAAPGFELVREWGQSGLRDGQFMSPASLATARDGDILVLDVFSRRLQVMTPEGRFVRKVGGGQLRKNSDVAVSRGGDVYVGGYLESLVRGIARFSPTR